ANEKADTQRAAEATLRGNPGEVGVDKAALTGLGILAAGGVAVAAGVAALPFGVAFVALKWASPAVRKTLPAILVLTQVRKRQEAEVAVATEDVS
ncbi:MAG: hypothetical protein U0263_40535, partial [Polyangiaceae bacterium]